MQEAWAAEPSRRAHVMALRIPAGRRAAPGAETAGAIHRTPGLGDHEHHHTSGQPNAVGAEVDGEEKQSTCIQLFGINSIDGSRDDLPRKRSYPRICWPPFGSRMTNNCMGSNHLAL